MTRPPAFHIWKFLMKNMTSPNSGLSVQFIIRGMTFYSSTSKINATASCSVSGSVNHVLQIIIRRNGFTNPFFLANPSLATWSYSYPRTSHACYLYTFTSNDGQ